MHEQSTGLFVAIAFADKQLDASVKVFASKKCQSSTDKQQRVDDAPVASKTSLEAISLATEWMTRLC